MSKKCEGFTAGTKRCGKPAIGVINKGGMKWNVCSGCRQGYPLIKKF